MSSQIPLLPGYRRDIGIHGQHHKSHLFDVLHGSTALEVKRDVRVDPRTVSVPSSFDGTGTLKHVGGSIIAGAAAVSQNSAATSYTNSGRIPVPLEAPFASANQRAAADPHAHLRRAPVARDFENAAEPLSHLPVLGESKLPAWVEFDRKVLRFSGYFKEAVHASAHESWRIRPILLYYYLADGTLHIAEPPVVNAGIPQGVLVKRHRVPKDAMGGTLQPEDLYLGAELPIYGRVYRLTDCDAFTRAFYEKNGAPLGEPEDMPRDSFSMRNVARAALSFKKTANDMTLHQEARLGKHLHGGIEKTQKFLKNDGKVLRFYAQWEDPQLYGEKRPYIVHFFLASDEFEILEVSQPNSGRDPFPALLKRSRLPKDHTRVHRDVGHLGGEVAPDPLLLFYSDADLRVGSMLNVYGRQLLLCGMDEFTRQYYRRTYGMSEEQLQSINMDEAHEEPPRIEVPPHTGFGTEEDSLGSFLHLVPRAPKTDQARLVTMDGILLRFACMFTTPAPVDRERKFILTYYLANNTLQLFEILERNQGHIAGKWLERQRVKNLRAADGPRWFEPADLFIGARILVNGTEFSLLDADQYTQNFQQQNPHIWSAERGNLNDKEKAQKLARGRQIDWKPSTTSNTLPDRRPW